MIRLIILQCGLLLLYQLFQNATQQQGESERFLLVNINVSLHVSDS